MKTEEEISKEAQELKAKYPGNSTLTIATNDDETEFVSVILRKIDRTTFNAANKMLGNDPLKATEMLLRTLYIGGDPIEAILPADEQQKFENLRAADTYLSKMIKAREGALKKN